MDSNKIDLINTRCSRNKIIVITSSLLQKVLTVQELEAKWAAVDSRGQRSLPVSDWVESSYCNDDF